MKISIIVAFLVISAYVSADDAQCNNDPCTKGYRACVKKGGGSKEVHEKCGREYLACKQKCVKKTYIIFGKCMKAKKSNANLCKKIAKAYNKKNCPQLNPCVVKCKKESKDKKSFIECVKKCKCQKTDE